MRVRSFGKILLLNMLTAALLACLLVACPGVQAAISGYASSDAFACDVEPRLSERLGFPVYSWKRDSAKPRAIIFAMHGATLHARSFDAVSSALAGRGYHVYAADMRGFGSWKDRADTAYPHHILYNQTQADFLDLLGHLRRDNADTPIFLMGESVGANMAVAMLAIDPFCADGAILSSPAVAQRWFLGPTVVKQLFQVLFHPSVQLDVSPYIKSRISQDPKVVEERLSDPLSRNCMNVGELVKTRWFNKRALRLAPLVPEHVSVMIVEGEEDRLFFSDDVDSIYAQLKTPNKVLHRISGKGHIQLETQYLDPHVLELLSRWLDNNVEAQRTAGAFRVEKQVSDTLAF